MHSHTLNVLKIEYFVIKTDHFQIIFTILLKKINIKKNEEVRVPQAISQLFAILGLHSRILEVIYTDKALSIGL